MKRFLLMLVFLFFYNIVQAVPIATIEMGDGRRTEGGLGVALGYTLNAENFPDSFTIFSGYAKAPDVGDLFILNSGDVFDATVDFFSNSEDGWLSFYSGGDGLTIKESDLFSEVSINGIDLEGFSIGFISLEITGFTEWSNGYGDGQRSMSVMFTIDDGLPQLPEPSTIFLFGLGLLGLTGVSRKP
ncbi:MAG: PEP-CTERM sorting domain-containing protein [Pseudomonadota bacterium]